MNTLADEKIQLSKKGDPALDNQAITDLLAQLPGWELVVENGVEKIQRQYKFRDYLMILDLGHKIGMIGEQVNHHPVMLTEWGRLTVTWWTHVIGGLHRNDFIMAAKCDRVAMLVSAP